jgi:SAM-dependent methyltransferase
MASLKQIVIASIGAALVFLLPLSLRKSMIVWLGKRRDSRTYRLAFELLRDFSKNDPGGFHRFLWSNHLGHAESYEIVRRYGDSQFEPTRLVLFQEICSHLKSRGIVPERDVKSVFDAGCSLGYVLRFAETEVFPSAMVLQGIDVDSYAVAAGSSHLRQLGSKATLHCADMTTLAQELDGEVYDVVLCFGVLMYLDSPPAAEAVRIMLRHCKMLLALSSWPHPFQDNAELDRSVDASGLVRNAADIMEGVLIHNLDAMVKDAGGRVISRRWTGSELVQGDKPLYFVLAEPNCP